VRASLFCSPLRLHGDEVGDVLGDEATIVELSEDEELLIGEPAEFGLFLYCDGIDTAPSEPFGNCGREHIVEEQPHR